MANLNNYVDSNKINVKAQDRIAMALNWKSFVLGDSFESQSIEIGRILQPIFFYISKTESIHFSQGSFSG